MLQLQFHHMKLLSFSRKAQKWVCFSFCSTRIIFQVRLFSRVCCDFRAAEATEEVTKLRPVRLIREDGIIRPYDLTESQGFDLFQVRSLWPFCSITRCCLLRGSRRGRLLLKTKTVLPQNQSADKNPKQQLWTHTPDIYELKTSWAKTHIHTVNTRYEKSDVSCWKTAEKLYSGAANIFSQKLKWKIVHHQAGCSTLRLCF